MRENFYQWSLILLLLAVTALTGVFVMRELFPEYKEYQNRYVALEEIRAEIDGTQPPPFKKGVKQVVIPGENNGPETIDRCISCHVAGELEHFSPTSVKRDINGNIVVDSRGQALLEPNPNYIWGIVDARIEELSNPQREEQLLAEGNRQQVKANSRELETLQALKRVQVGHHEYDVTKVLRMHPLIGKETRPFELHPIEDYGCTSCHNGNGRGLTTDKAHGPVYDGQYEIEEMGHEAHFTEPDPKNDPNFARVFNHKPGHHLLFQTTPLFVDGVIQARCAQCHRSSEEQIEDGLSRLSRLESGKANELDRVQSSFEQDKEAVVTLLQLKRRLDAGEVTGTIDALREELADPSLTDRERNIVEGQLYYVEQNSDPSYLQKKVEADLLSFLGSEELVTAAEDEVESEADLDLFLADREGRGLLFQKEEALDKGERARARIEEMDQRLRNVLDRNIVESLRTDVDLLTGSYARGKRLFLSQACYACHRISGFSRGGIGPELTQIGLMYPWYVKESIVWPQADLPTSTMPNFHLDPHEVEDLMAFLMAQRDEDILVSKIDRRIQITNWDAGEQVSWEKPIPASELHDVRNSMKVFAVEGCASCHRLKGFSSDVGFTAERTGDDFATIWPERVWFRELFPEEILGSDLVARIEEHADEIDRRIAHSIHTDSLIEEIDEEHPGMVEAFYSNFQYAYRAQNYRLDEGVDEVDFVTEWQDRVKRILAMYIQEYGLGRMIGPRLNWSGIFRSDEWLIEHFRNPSAHAAKSIMPVFPFDDSKFYALTHMLNVLGEKNRDEIREIWSERGFNPELAYRMLCSNCHGNYLQGDGVTAQWIYPIPKNLRDPIFMRNLTKERVMQALEHGVRGGPMPPWKEIGKGKKLVNNTPVLTKQEIIQMTDWLFQSLPGSRIMDINEDVRKWQYDPEDILEELEKEGSIEELRRTNQHDLSYNDHLINQILYVALEPKVYHKDAFDVEDLFDVRRVGKRKRYYLKEVYYTPENIEQGRQLFLLHCAVCHGSEGQGNGERAQAMKSAKPRMLTNLDWLETRDDLRLLRSLKYGVQGTSMTPWGDYTSSLQRIQLVVFIRSLSAERKQQVGLEEGIFQAFEDERINLLRLKANDDERYQKLAKQLELLRQQRMDLHTQLNEESGAGKEEALALYTEELKTLQELSVRQQFIRLLDELTVTLQEEENLYYKLGKAIIERKVDPVILQSFLELLKVHNDSFVVAEDEILLEKPEEVESLRTAITTELNQRLEEVASRKQKVEGKLPSTERREEEQALHEELSGLEALKRQFAMTFVETDRIHDKQEALVTKYQQLKKELGS